MGEPFGALGRIRMKAHLSPCFDQLDILAIEGSGEDLRCIKTVEAVKIGCGYSLDPIARIDQEAAQELMDSLWQCGIRPSEKTAGPEKGELVSVREHLDDMRRLVFASMKMEEPARQRNVR